MVAWKIPARGDLRRPRHDRPVNRDTHCLVGDESKILEHQARSAGTLRACRRCGGDSGNSPRSLRTGARPCRCRGFDACAPRSPDRRRRVSRPGLRGEPRTDVRQRRAHRRTQMGFDREESLVCCRHAERWSACRHADGDRVDADDLAPHLLHVERPRGVDDLVQLLGLQHAGLGVDDDVAAKDDQRRQRRDLELLDHRALRVGIDLGEQGVGVAGGGGGKARRERAAQHGRRRPEADHRERMAVDGGGEFCSVSSITPRAGADSG